MKKLIITTLLIFLGLMTLTVVANLSYPTIRKLYLKKGQQQTRDDSTIALGIKLGHPTRIEFSAV